MPWWWSPPASKRGWSEGRELRRLIALNGHAVYEFGLVGNPAPFVEWNTQRIKKPQVGDLVLEMSTYYMWARDPEGDPWNALGYLTHTGREPIMTQRDLDKMHAEDNYWHDPDETLADIPDEEVWYLTPLWYDQLREWQQGRRTVLWGRGEQVLLRPTIRWHTADFIAVNNKPLMNEKPEGWRSYKDRYAASNSDEKVSELEGVLRQYEEKGARVQLNLKPQYDLPVSGVVTYVGEGRAMVGGRNMDLRHVASAAPEDLSYDYMGDTDRLPIWFAVRD